MWKKIKLILIFRLWNRLPGFFQIIASRVVAHGYNISLSRFIIPLFCRLNALDSVYLAQFMPANGRTNRYLTFQDFFTRRYRNPPVLQGEHVWPCEGYVCQQGFVSELPEVNIKGEAKSVKAVFDAGSTLVPDTHFFTNIFLHNHNYHRIHAPVTGSISRMEWLPGDLAVLRPWVYEKSRISEPAMRNERFNVDIVDKHGKTWFMSVVGGMAVGTIQLAVSTVIGAQVSVGQEIAVFLLGSTCCLASPTEVTSMAYLQSVAVGEELCCKD